jgi:hypothetical protein
MAKEAKRFDGGNLVVPVTRAMVEELERVAPSRLGQRSAWVRAALDRELARAKRAEAALAEELAAARDGAA